MSKSSITSKRGRKAIATSSRQRMRYVLSPANLVPEPPSSEVKFKGRYSQFRPHHAPEHLSAGYQTVEVVTGTLPPND